MEVSGRIVALGAGVDQIGVGDDVVGGTRTGGFAEFAIASAAQVRLKPRRLSFAEASACGAAYLTAYVAMVRRAKAEPGEWVLVQGAAGGAGLACVDLAMVLGCRVIAASASENKLRVVAREYAPQATVNVTGGFRDKIMAITDGAGANVIFDPVGGDIFDESVRCIAFDGRLLVVGFTSGRIPSIPVNMPLIKGFSVVGVRAGEYGRRFPEKGRQNIEAVWTLANDGAIQPRVHAQFPLANWREAFDLLANREVIGKAVIRPDI
jgi:NADPH2:quinone reductase